MKAIANSSVSKNADKVREQFHGLLAKTNKEHPRPADVEALSKVLYQNRNMKLWKAVIGMGALAEDASLKTISGVGTSGRGFQECWKHRLEAMRADLGDASSPPLEQLLIQQVTLCWLHLNLVEYRHTNVMKHSVGLSVGLYWEKRLTMAQRRFTRSCESLARVRRLSSRNPISVNIATRGGQQINVAREG